MGTSRNSAELAGKLTAAAAGAAELNRRGVSAAAFAHKRSALLVARGDTGGDLRLSRAGARLGDGQRRGIKLGAGYDVKGTVNAVAILKARPMGPWRWLEDGTPRHSIAPRRRRGARVLALAGGEFRPGVVHPGAKEKKTWTRGVRAGTPLAQRAYRTVVAKGLLQRFR